MLVLMKRSKVRLHWSMILIVVIMAAVAIILYATNAVQNLFFASIRMEQIDEITVYAQFGERKAILSEEDVGALVSLLKRVRLKGRDRRVYAVENYNPQYSVRLDNGIYFNIACYDNCYIVDGKGYYVGESIQTNKDYINYGLIGLGYLEHLENRNYFPREVDREG